MVTENGIREFAPVDPWLDDKLREAAPKEVVQHQSAKMEMLDARFDPTKVRGGAIPKTVPDVQTYVPQTPVNWAGDPAKGKKLDAGKTDYSLVPWDAVREIGRVLYYGAYQKPQPDGTYGYGRNNWHLVEDAKYRYGSAAIRHVTAACFEDEDIDPDTKEHKLWHLAEAGCCVLFLLALGLRGKLHVDGPVR